MIRTFRQEAFKWTAMNAVRFEFLILIIVFLSCKQSKKDIYAAIEKFDHSLDSLVVEKMFNTPKVIVFQSDTLFHDPEMMEETYYMFIGKDSVKVDANCSILRFKDNRFIMNTSEDFMGRKFVQKMIYFDNRIDNKLLERLRIIKSDTVYIGCVYKYNEKGQLIKKLESNIWRNVQKDGSILVKNTRLLEVYNYNNDNTTTTYRKEYFNMHYNVDSLRDIKIKTFRSAESNTWAADRKEYTYKLDKFGNWTEKRNRFPNREVRYRKYHYSNPVQRAHQ